MNLKNLAIMATGAALALAAVACTASSLDAEPTPEPTPTHTTLPDDWTQGLPPCILEDDLNCYWDASTMGNGIGHDFINIDGILTYPNGQPEIEPTPEPTPEPATPAPVPTQTSRPIPPTCQG